MTDPAIDSLYNQPTEAIVQTQSPFDINALFSAAVLNAVNAATAPLVERINTLQHNATTDIANLTQRSQLLERSLAVADKAAQGNESDLFSRVATLEEQMIAKQDNIDERIKEIADEVAREVLYEHNEEYDHDGYDRLEERIEDKVNDAIEEYDFDDKIKDVLNGAHISINV
jgi:hypothetical protein